MPRIAVALFVFAAAAFCIGFNIVRYPIVWEKLATLESLAQSIGLEQPAASEAAGGGPAPAWSNESSAPAGESANPEPVLASIPGAPDHDLSEPLPEEDGDGMPAHGEVRRLPSVEDWEPCPLRDPSLPAAPVPSYPSTGME